MVEALLSDQVGVQGQPGRMAKLRPQSLRQTDVETFDTLIIQHTHLIVIKPDDDYHPWPGDYDAI